MKKIFSLIMFAILILSSISYAEENAANTETTDVTAETTADTVALEESIADEAVSDAEVDAALAATPEADNTFTRAKDRIKYAFTLNKEKKAGHALDMAKKKMLLAEKQASKNNTGAAENAQEQYGKWMERAQGAMQKLSPETKLEAAAKLQNKITLNEKIVEKVKTRLAEAPITAQQKEAMLARLKTAKENTLQVKLAAEKRLDVIEKRLSQVENLTPEQIEEKKIEARLGNATAGNAASTEAFIRIAKRDVEKAKSILESLTEADATAITKANEIIAKAESEIALSEIAKAEGKYSEAKENALNARRIVMNAYMRSKFNALPQAAKDKIATMTPEQRADLEKRVRQTMNARETKAIADRIDARIENRQEGKMCAQVITPAVNAEGRCNEFPTPCDVPLGWRRVESCKQTMANTIQETAAETITASTTTIEASTTEDSADTATRTTTTTTAAITTETAVADATITTTATTAAN